MTNKNTKKRLALIVMVSSLCAIVLTLVSFTSIVLARSMDDAILAKAYYAAVKQCYTGGKMVKNIDTLDYLFWGNTKGNGILEASSSKKDIPMPNTLATTPTSCADILKDLIGKSGISAPSYKNLKEAAMDTTQTAEFLEKMGYVETKSGQATTGECIGAKYLQGTDISNPNYSDTPLLCADNIDNSGKIQVDKLSVKGSESFVKFDVGTKHKVKISCGYKNSKQRGTTLKKWNASQTISFTPGGSWDSFKAQIDSFFQNTCNKVEVIKSEKRVKGQLQQDKESYSYKEAISEPAKSQNSTYSNKGSTSAELAYRNLLGMDPPSSGAKFTEEEMIALYYTYLWDVYGINPKDTNQFMCDPTAEQLSNMQAVGGWLQFKVFAEGKMNSNCWIKISESNSKKVNGLTGGRVFSKEVGVAEIRAALNGAGASSMPEDYDWGKVDTSDPDGSEGGATTGSVDQDDCMKIGGAMGWILCPTMLALKDALTNLYDQAVEPMLQVRSSLVSTDSGTFSAWEIFRTFANIVFVIALLFIIFSQVTGYGIDNYGIKKTLPKLIVTAILINFSFIICQLAVDVSNILGAGLNSFFTNLANGESTGVAITIGSETSDPITAGPGFMGNAIGVFGTAIAAVAAGTAAFMALAGFGSLLLTMIVTLLGVLASVLFMFLSLGLRMTGVVILTALAPVAFVAYALPNTNGIFRKWFNAFKGLLLLYPICGLLIGGGQFASMVVLNTLPGAAEGNDILVFFYVIIAILVSILPFFAMPSLLKKSMETVGMGAVSTFGNNLRNRINGIKKTEGFKRASNRADHAVQSAGLRFGRFARQSAVGQAVGNSAVARGARRLANTKVGRVVTAPARFATAAANRNIARTEAAYSKMESEDAKAEAAVLNRTDPISYDEGIRRIDDAIARRDYHAVRVNEARIAGMGRQKDLATHIASRLDSLNNVGADDGQKRQLRTLRTAFGQDSEVYKQLTTKDTAASNMLADSAEDRTLAQYTADFADGIENKDLATQGTDALHRLAPHISQNQANEVLNSSDPNIQSGMLSDSGKRAVFEAIAGGANNVAGPTIFGNRQAVAHAADNYRGQQQQAQAAQQAAAARVAADTAADLRAEQAAANEGKLNVQAQNSSGATINVDLYRAPKGFRAATSTPQQDSDGRYYLDEVNSQGIKTGRRWNASTAQFEGGRNYQAEQIQGPTPPPAPSP